MVLIKNKAIFLVFLAVSAMTLSIPTHESIAANQVHQTLTDHLQNQNQVHEGLTTNVIEAHQLNTQTGQIHEAVPVIAAAAGVTNAALGAINLGLNIWTQVAKTLTCPNGYLRNNYLTITNQLTSTITYDNSYFDSGWMWRYPATTISAGSSQTYQTVKTSRTATGSNVMFTYSIAGSTKKITVLMENPWSGWPLIAVCYGQYSISNKVNYYSIYNRVYQLAANRGYRKNINNYNDGNCFYIEDIYAKASTFTTTYAQNIGGINFGVQWDYEATPSGGLISGTCYTTKLAVVVA